VAENLATKLEVLHLKPSITKRKEIYATTWINLHAKYKTKKQDANIK
jgi:hypothetical protein